VITGRLKNIIDYLLVFGIIANSTMPLFMSKTWVIIIFICYGLVYISFKHYKVSKGIIYVIIFLSFILLVQIINFGSFYFQTMILQFMYFINAFFCVTIVGDRFFKIFSKIIYFFIIPSLIIFALHLFYLEDIEKFASSLPDFFTIIDTIYNNKIYSSSIVIYYFNPNSFIEPRNNGPFWEAGVYAGMLTLAFIINIIYEKKLLTQENIFFVLATITTFSSTAYIAIFFILIAYWLIVSRFSIVKIIIAILSLAPAIYLFNTIPFLGEKIISERENVEFAIEERGGDSRLASAILDIQELLSSPSSAIFGNGSHPITRLGKLQGSLRNNGFTDLFARWGIPFSLIYIYLMFISLKKFAQKEKRNVLFAWTFFISIMLLSQSEPYYRYSLFHCFIFLSPYLVENDKVYN
jgi:hypothetical protein